MPFGWNMEFMVIGAKSQRAICHGTLSPPALLDNFDTEL
jgi:hypothetical protein